MSKPLLICRSFSQSLAFRRKIVGNETHNTNYFHIYSFSSLTVISTTFYLLSSQNQLQLSCFLHQKRLLGFGPAREDHYFSPSQTHMELSALLLMFGSSWLDITINLIWLVESYTGSGLHHNLQVKIVQQSSDSKLSYYKNVINNGVITEHLIYHRVSE